MTASRRATALRYGFALLVTAAALLTLNLPVVKEGRSSGGLIALLAVLLSAWLGGMGPGLFSTALVVAGTFRSDPSVWRTLRLAVFVADGVLISLAVGALRAATRRAEA